jgi:hypothetical protein
MNSAYEIDYLSEQNNKRIARHVKESRAPQKKKEQDVGSSLVLKTRLAIATALALFFGG